MPDLILERYRLGEMTPDETAAFERRVHGDDELRQRLEALEASDEEIRRRYPPAVLAAHVRQRLEACVPDTRRTAGAGFFGPRWKTLAALAGVLVLAVLVGPALLGPREEPTDRIKGLEPTLLLFRKTAAVTAVLFLVDLTIPDMIPFADEILLGLLSLLLASLKKRSPGGG